MKVTCGKCHRSFDGQERSMRCPHDRICPLRDARSAYSLLAGQTFPTEDDRWDHLEAVHHRPQIREGETEADAIGRFLARYPDAITCQDCRLKKAPWTRAS